jgi:4-hydroxy-3-polyprenylbenzoate decarboxylase
MASASESPDHARRVVVGVTGASGSIYAFRLVSELLARGLEVHLVASSAGRQVIRAELPEHAGSAETIFTGLPAGDLRVHGEKDFFAPYCSGSFRFRAMVVVPASMGSVAAIAGGYVANGIHRAADVALKERIPLIVVPRETPLSTVHLRNLLALSEAGAVILPPVPAFYTRPRTIEDQINFVIARVLDRLGIENSLSPRWREP